MTRSENNEHEQRKRIMREDLVRWLTEKVKSNLSSDVLIRPLGKTL